MKYIKIQTSWLKMACVESSETSCISTKKSLLISIFVLFFQKKKNIYTYLKLITFSREGNIA